jgi:beta-N-acetylhexosaminidase
VLRALVVALLLLGPGAPPQPPIVDKPIPFDAKRKAETAAYARRHYGLDTWRLVRPRVIVEHYTGSDTFAGAYSTFAADARDSELHELPGTCAHFVIDRNGTIYQLVSVTTMCRHTVGLNYTAIGIEHVGRSDAEILGNPRQLRASLALTVWLMSRYGIELRNVIGHNESLTSPYHRERVAAWRCQTHGDWNHTDMEIYRSHLARLAMRFGVRLGPPAQPAKSAC